MNKVFLLSLLYFVSCQLECTYITIFPSKPENCHERITPKGQKCCFYTAIVKLRRDFNLTNSFCCPLSNDYTDEMLYSWLVDSLKNFDKNIEYTFHTSCP